MVAFNFKMLYEPSDDSFLLAEQVKKFSKNNSVLDIGSGTGIQIEIAKNYGASSILATDINPEAIKILKSKKIPCIKSDLCSKVKGKYDLIIFNPPYLPEYLSEDSDSKLITTGGKNGDELILKFLKKSKKHLNKNGNILLLISSLTPRRKINFLIKKLNLKKSILSYKKIFFEVLEVWKLKNI